MKKRYFLSNIRFSAFFFLLFILFGCMEEDKFHLNEGNKSISASIIEENLGTRTLLSDNPTNRKMEVYWKSGDAIGVFGSISGLNVLYQTEESAISKDGKTTEFSTTATAAEGGLTAYYPYQQGATATPDGVLHLTMPAIQKYVTGQTAIVQPDPLANIMAGKGKDGSIVFRNLFAILRVNIAGSDGQTVKKVLFTDLSGKPVSGKFSVSWNGDIPEAEFPETGSGNDLQIGLDCEDGVPLSSNSLTKFFLIVPARNYDKGFQIEFILSNGEKIIKTIGASAGKILLRNMLYPIGDMFPSQEDKVSYTLHEKASIITDERFDYIQSASLNPENHHLTIKVDEGFAPVIGEMILINQTSTSLPKGYVGKVKSISGTTVVLEPVTKITEIFEELSIGGPVWSGDGTAIPTGGYAIDLSQFVTSIETPDGKPVEFAVDGSSLSMQVPYTRAEAGFDTKFSSPTLSQLLRLMTR
ncbi:MAG: fimbrillin family protein [Dysgonamonadaceae bacterium]|nr:fimbrillin family protein [Dysgonamonadaceae bacterium]